MLGTIAAVMRVSPVAMLRFLGTSYVNVFRNTPLTLLMVGSVLGLTYILGLSLDKHRHHAERPALGRGGPRRLPRRLRL